MKSTHTTLNLVSTLGLSLLTSPFIFSLLALHFFTKTAIELGQASEEIFRAARLPILYFPDSDY
ncbi:MAG: hypothetical protein QNJ41_15315 [Xenococcaceae cyanobacterium MO_188.B32]|nr:hypothetical protein [Xenococcaceae cyanobacterium MO_188.B32]